MVAAIGRSCNRMDNDPYDFALDGNFDYDLGDDEEDEEDAQVLPTNPRHTDIVNDRSKPMQWQSYAKTGKSASKSSSILEKAKAMLSKKAPARTTDRSSYTARHSDPAFTDFLDDLISDDENGDEDASTEARHVAVDSYRESRKSSASVVGNFEQSVGAGTTDVHSDICNDILDAPQHSAFSKSSLSIEKPQQTYSPSPSTNKSLKRDWDIDSADDNMRDSTNAQLAGSSAFRALHSVSVLEVDQNASPTDVGQETLDTAEGLIDIERWQHADTTPLTATTKGKLSSSQRGFIRSINDLNDVQTSSSILPPRESESTFDFGAIREAGESVSIDGIDNMLQGHSALEQTACLKLTGNSQDDSILDRGEEHVIKPLTKENQRPCAENFSNNSVADIDTVSHNSMNEGARHTTMMSCLQDQRQANSFDGSSRNNALSETATKNHFSLHGETKWDAVLGNAKARNRKHDGMTQQRNSNEVNKAKNGGNGNDGGDYNADTHTSMPRGSHSGAKVMTFKDVEDILV